MPFYKCKMIKRIDRSSYTVEQKLLYANSKKELLEKCNYIISCRKYKKHQIDAKTFVLRFFRIIHSLIANGYNTVQTLTIATNCFKGTQKLVIQTVLDKINSGSSFSEALSQFDTFFDSTVIEILHVSEMTGRLEISIWNIIEYLEYKMQFYTKIKNATRYPIFVLMLISIISVIWIIWIIPQFSNIFKELELSMPAITKYLLELSVFIKAHYFIIFAIFILIFSIVKYLNIKIPIISTFRKELSKLQFLETMGLMLKENVNLLNAIKCVTKRPEFCKYSKLIELITDGSSFTKAAECLGLFSPQEISIISVSEKTGQYWVAFKTLADIVKLNIEDSFNKLTKRLPSILICIVGALLVLFIYGTFFPLYSSIDVVVENPVH